MTTPPVRSRIARPAPRFISPVPPISSLILRSRDINATPTLASTLSWLVPDMRMVYEEISQWGFDINIYDVPDLESFLRAVLLVPRSITSDFNFPEWRYFGRGPGERGEYHRYQKDAE